LYLKGNQSLFRGFVFVHLDVFLRLESVILAGEVLQDSERDVGDGAVASEDVLLQLCDDHQEAKADFS
jgi:hypothetical protein